MARLLDRGRIRGVSFHRASAAPRSQEPRQPVSLSHQKIVEEMKKGAPRRLSKGDVHRLLGDHARTEIHALVLEAIEHSTRWRQLWQSLEKSSQTRDRLRTRHELASNLEEDLPADSDQAALSIEARHMFGLWRHRLEVLELIAAAQHSLPGEQLLSRSLNHRAAPKNKL